MRKWFMIVSAVMVSGILLIVLNFLIYEAHEKTVASNAAHAKANAAHAEACGAFAHIMGQNPKVAASTIPDINLRHQVDILTYNGKLDEAGMMVRVYYLATYPSLASCRS